MHRLQHITGKQNKANKTTSISVPHFHFNKKENKMKENIFFRIKADNFNWIPTIYKIILKMENRNKILKIIP